MTKDRDIKKAKIEWYSRKRCVDKYYAERFIEPMGRMRDLVEKRIVLNNVRGLVLDAGCGPGRFALPIAQQPRVTHVVGIDTSHEMLKFLNSETEREKNGTTTPVRGDIEHMPFPDNTFDTVVTVHVLFHLPQYAEIVKEFIRVLKPGGRMVVDFTSADYLDFIDNNWLIQAGAAVIGKERLRRKIVTPRNPENEDLDFYANVSRREYRRMIRRNGAVLRKRYCYDMHHSIWLTNGLLGSGRLMKWILSFPLLFKLFYFMEVFLFRYLPPFLCPRYFIVAEKK